MERRFDKNDLRPVLDYGMVPPPPSFREVMFGVPERIIDACGGTTSFLVVVSLCCLEIAVIAPTGLGFLALIATLAIWMALFHRWTKSSRWF